MDFFREFWGFHIRYCMCCSGLIPLSASRKMYFAGAASFLSMSLY